MTDPITDMLNQIRNAQAVLHPTVSVTFSDLKYRVAKILERKKLVEKVEKKGKKVKRFIEIALKYEDGAPVISGLKKVSTPGQRIYVSSREIRKVRGGYGIAIISTPKGLMTDREAKRQKLGGEVLCEIW